MILQVIQPLRTRLQEIPTLKNIQLYNDNIDRAGTLTEYPVAWLEFPSLQITTLRHHTQQADAMLIVWIITKALSDRNLELPDTKIEGHEQIDIEVFTKLHRWKTTADIDGFYPFGALQRTGYELELGRGGLLITKHTFTLNIYQKDTSAKQTTDTPPIGIDIPT